MAEAGCAPGEELGGDEQLVVRCSIAQHRLAALHHGAHLCTTLHGTFMAIQLSK